MHIYGLIDPRNNQIAYVGRAEDAHIRWEQHITDRTDLPKATWIRGLLASGVAPIVVILETVPDEQDWDNSERWWIAQGIRMGWPLLNKTHISTMQKLRQTDDTDTQDLPPVRAVYTLPTLPAIKNIAIRPVEDISYTLVEGVPIEDVMDFIDGLPQRGHSQRGWADHRFPSGALGDALYWKKLSKILRKGGLIEGVGPRRSGRLLLKDPEAIKRHLGLAQETANVQ